MKKFKVKISIDGEVGAFNDEGIEKYLRDDRDDVLRKELEELFPTETIPNEGYTKYNINVKSEIVEEE